MLKILKDNLIYISFVLVIWLVFFPIIYINRHKILAWYSIKVSSPKYDKGKMNSLVEKADKELKNDNINLDIMEDICIYYKDLNKEDEMFYEPKWYDKKTRWSNSKLNLDDLKNTKFRNPMIGSINPPDYWKTNIETVLTALDYYKRALNYSGPEYIVVQKIEKAAKASCRNQEILLAHTSHLFSAEDYVYNKLKKENRFPDNLTPKMELSLVWEEIKSNRIEQLSANDYMKSLNQLIFNTRLRSLSPYEASKIYERLNFFSQADEWEEKQIRFKWGILLFNLGKEDKNYYEKARLQFQASRHFNDLSKLGESHIRLILNHIFQADLMIAKIYLEQQKYLDSLNYLYKMNSDKHRIDGTEGRADIELLDDFNSTLKTVYRKLGRLREADQIESNKVQ